ncbi:dual specificity protein kinase yak1 [Mortierella polycephala]|uniref:Dual specificity protein kinase yak1 n=1 Tax=Mortierella polycephala TaxID=41804 RepID=A0A9P6QCX4_9FUNG|nr:dual specificity protein kinase yak1 [Mortierella polycephala]
MDSFSQGQGPHAEIEVDSQQQQPAMHQQAQRYRHVSAPIQQPQNLSSFQEGMRQDSINVNASSATMDATGGEERGARHDYGQDHEASYSGTSNTNNSMGGKHFTSQPSHQSQQHPHGNLADRSTGHVGIMIDNQQGHGPEHGHEQHGHEQHGHEQYGHEQYGQSAGHGFAQGYSLSDSPSFHQTMSQHPLQQQQSQQQTEPLPPAVKGHSGRGGSSHSGMFQQGYSQYQGQLPGAKLSRHLSIQLTPNPMLLPPPPPALHAGSHGHHSTVSMEGHLRDSGPAQSREFTVPPPTAAVTNHSNVAPHTLHASPPPLQQQQQQQIQQQPQQQPQQLQQQPRQSASPQSVTLPPPTAKYIRSPMRSPKMPQLSSQAMAYAQAQSQAHPQYRHSHSYYHHQHGPSSGHSQHQFPPRTHRRSIQPLTLDQQQPKGGSFRYVRNQADLWPQKGSQKYRSIDAYGHSVSPLRALTELLTKTYSHCNRDFKYEPSYNPRRVLTKPSKPMHNEGYDNEDYDYILYVSDILGSEERQRYIILDVLGQGTFGQVVKCQNLKTNQIVAVKVIKNRPAYFNQSMMEVTVLGLLNERYDVDDRHHILRLEDTFIHRRHLCLVFELLSVNLYELIKQNQFRGLSMSLVRVFTAQLLDALCVLNEARIIHCDLKPENVLLKNLETPTIKVIDFGSACHEQQTVYTYIQSRFYRSPEVLVGLPYSLAIDIWSVGCIAAELFLGLPLFPGSSEYNQLSRIVEMLGILPSYMLEIGKTAHEFFEMVRPDHAGHTYNASAPKKYRLKSMDTYSREHRVIEQPSKRYFQATSLPDIINTYPMMKKGMTPKEVDKEMGTRASFINFLQGLLNLNPIERWSPHQAKLHPFITGEPFTGNFIPPTIPKKPQTAENSARLEPTMPGRSSKTRSASVSGVSSMSALSSSPLASASDTKAWQQSHIGHPANATKSSQLPVQPQPSVTKSNASSNSSTVGAPPSLSALGGSMGTSSESSLGSSATDASSLNGSPAMANSLQINDAGASTTASGSTGTSVAFAPEAHTNDSSSVQTSAALPHSAPLHHQQRPRATTMGTVEVPKNMVQLAAAMTPQQGPGGLGGISSTSSLSHRTEPNDSVNDHTPTSPYSGSFGGYGGSSSNAYGLRQIPERSEQNSPTFDGSTSTSSDSPSSFGDISQQSAQGSSRPMQQQQQRSHRQQPHRYLHRSGSESLGKGAANLSLRDIVENTSDNTAGGTTTATKDRAQEYTHEDNADASSSSPSSSAMADLTPLQRMQQQLVQGQTHQQQQQQYHFGYPQSGSSLTGTGSSNSGVDSNSSSRQGFLSEPDFETDGGSLRHLDLGSSRSGSSESLGSSSSISNEVEGMEELDELVYQDRPHRHIGHDMGSSRSQSGNSGSDGSTESPHLESLVENAEAAGIAPFVSPPPTSDLAIVSTAGECVLSNVEEEEEEEDGGEDDGKQQQQRQRVGGARFVLEDEDQDQDQESDLSGEVPPTTAAGARSI